MGNAYDPQETFRLIDAQPVLGQKKVDSDFGGKSMPHAHPGDPTPWNVENLFARDLDVRDLSLLYAQIRVAAIDVAGPDKGTLQCLDDQTGCLKIVASRGFAAEMLNWSIIWRG
jgi:hypothetical protein